jgi:hypothetical protein
MGSDGQTDRRSSTAQRNCLAIGYRGGGSGCGVVLAFHEIPNHRPSSDESTLTRTRCFGLSWGRIETNREHTLQESQVKRRVSGAGYAAAVGSR